MNATSFWSVKSLRRRRACALTQPLVGETRKSMSKRAASFQRDHSQIIGDAPYEIGNADSQIAIAACTQMPAYR